MPETSRVCTMCDIEKDIDQFPWSYGKTMGVRDTSKRWRNRRCVDCRRDLDRRRKEYGAHQKDRRITLRKMLIEYKKGKQCNRCGFSDFRAMEFHHIDSSTKEYTITRMVGRGMVWERVQREIDKCQLLCSNCHRIVEYERKQELGLLLV